MPPPFTEVSQQTKKRCFIIKIEPRKVFIHFIGTYPFVIVLCGISKRKLHNFRTDKRTKKDKIDIFLKYLLYVGISTCIWMKRLQIFEPPCTNRTWQLNISSLKFHSDAKTSPQFRMYSLEFVFWMGSKTWGFGSIRSSTIFKSYDACGFQRRKTTIKCAYLKFQWIYQIQFWPFWIGDCFSCACEIVCLSFIC